MSHRRRNCHIHGEGYCKYLVRQILSLALALQYLSDPALLKVNYYTTYAYTFASAALSAIFSLVGHPIAALNTCEVPRMTAI